MRPKENYTSFIAVAFGLTLAIVGAFQIYIMGEPARIEIDEARDKLIAVTGGRSLYNENCALCHGEEGEGVDGPPLNDKTFLNNTSNKRIFSLINSGVPSSVMPAWNQVYGGPFTDQQVNQIVAFVRDWTENAPDRIGIANEGNPVNGIVIFNSTCVVCHGDVGQGTENAPALDDPGRLGQFDDEWYVDTISGGRLAQGMPTWGTVLSSTQIRDLVALLRAWERGETIQLPGPEEKLQEALHSLEHGDDLHTIEHTLQSAAQGASGEVLSAINEAIEAVEAGDLNATEEAVNHALELLGAGLDGDSGEEHDDGDEHSD